MTGGGRVADCRHGVGRSWRLLRRAVSQRRRRRRFIARGPHFEAMRKHGLRIENEHEPIDLPKVNVTDDPSSIGRVDLILFAVKL